MDQKDKNREPRYLHELRDRQPDLKLMTGNSNSNVPLLSNSFEKCVENLSENNTQIQTTFKKEEPVRYLSSNSKSEKSICNDTTKLLTIQPESEETECDVDMDIPWNNQNLKPGSFVDSAEGSVRNANNPENLTNNKKTIFEESPPENLKTEEKPVSDILGYKTEGKSSDEPEAERYCCSNDNKFDATVGTELVCKTKPNLQIRIPLSVHRLNKCSYSHLIMERNKMMKLNEEKTFYISQSVLISVKLHQYGNDYMYMLTIRLRNSLKFVDKTKLLKKKMEEFYNFYCSTKSLFPIIIKDLLKFRESVSNIFDVFPTVRVEPEYGLTCINADLTDLDPFRLISVYHSEEQQVNVGELATITTQTSLSAVAISETNNLVTEANLSLNAEPGASQIPLGLIHSTVTSESSEVRELSAQFNDRSVLGISNPTFFSANRTHSSRCTSRTERGVVEAALDMTATCSTVTDQHSSRYVSGMINYSFFCANHMSASRIDRTVLETVFDGSTATRTDHTSVVVRQTLSQRTDVQYDYSDGASPAIRLTEQPTQHVLQQMLVGNRDLDSWDVPRQIGRRFVNTCAIDTVATVLFSLALKNTHLINFADPYMISEVMRNYRIGAFDALFHYVGCKMRESGGDHQREIDIVEAILGHTKLSLRSICSNEGCTIRHEETNLEILLNLRRRGQNGDLSNLLQQELEIRTADSEDPCDHCNSRETRRTSRVLNSPVVYINASESGITSDMITDQHQPFRVYGSQYEVAAMTFWHDNHFTARLFTGQRWKTYNNKFGLNDDPPVGFLSGIFLRKIS